MKKNPPDLIIEARVSEWFIADFERRKSVSIEREPSGRIAASARRSLIEALREFASQASGGRRRAICAVGAHGVSIRPVTLPASVKRDDELRRLLVFQIEKEFPAPPEDLAWARYRAESNGAMESTSSGQAGDSGEHLVAAVRRATIEDCAGIIREGGLSPVVITLAAASRSTVCGPEESAYSIIELGDHESELACFDRHVPVFVRVLPFGVGDLEQWMTETTPGSEAIATVSARLKPAMGSLPAMIRDRPLFVIGPNHIARLPDFASSIGSAIGGSISCRTISWRSDHSETPATLGLRNSLNGSGTIPGVVFETNTMEDSSAGPPGAAVAPWRNWAIALVALVLLAIVLRYSGPFLRGPALDRKLARIEAESGALAEMDGELAYLQFVATNRPPYLEALSGLADAVPPGTQIEVLSMDRRGEFAMRGTVANPEQAIAFRAKLIESGLFSTVIVEEQGPGSDNKKLQVRINARWK